MSLIAVLMILALLAVAMYFVYQKFVVEEDLVDTRAPMEPSVTPSVTPPSSDVPPGGVSGVDNMRGRVKANAAPVGIQYYGGNDKLVPKGQAKTADVCKEFAISNGINNWGWDRIDKSCFSYKDSSILSAMDNKNNIEGSSRYITGCVNPGVKVYDGCMDMTRLNPAWGVKGGEGNWYVGGPAEVMSLEECRALANDEGYEAFGYRTNRHGNVTTHGSCFYYADPQATLTGWVGNLGDKAHLTACTDPSKKVKDGCQ